MRAPLTPARRHRRTALVALVAALALVSAGCASDDGDEDTSSGATTETTAASTTEADDGATTTEADDGATTTEAPSSETTEATDPGDGGDTSMTEPTEGELAPGDACSLEEGVPDCIDPDGDGEGTYLLEGETCAANAPDISVCEDLDGDGVAGYPDEYADLPTCSADVPPPCNNPPGSSDDE